MKKQLIALIAVMAANMLPVAAQQEKESFEAFRKSVMEDYRTFRKKVLEDYGRFLEGIWQEYDAFRGEKRTPLPKPPKAPVAEVTPPPPVEQTPVMPQVPPVQEPVQPEPVPAPTPPLPGTLPVQEGIKFCFYKMELYGPDIEIGNQQATASPEGFASLWRLFSKQEVRRKVLPFLQDCAAEYQLNDWFLFELVRNYCDQLAATCTPTVRIALAHFLLNHLGYDVRIGIQGEDTPVLLVTFQQMVYARGFLNLGGQRFYVFHDIRNQSDAAAGGKFKTCNLPEDANTGRALDLIIHQELKIPYTPQAYHFAHGNLQIKGNINANLMPMLYRYPQMPIGCYALSVVNQACRDQVVEQLSRQLSGMSQHEAVDALLQFIQKAFQYATDDEQHGFEKPYFFEEMLFYPQCDCEDRSVFYSYLLWQVLQVENHLVGYPGHECVAVHLNTPITGTHYLYQGKPFYISDPTYIGAVTGECMPCYLNETPEVDPVTRK